MVRGGQIHKTALRARPGATAAAVDIAALLAAVGEELRPHLGAVAAGDFALRQDVAENLRGGARLRHIDLQQTMAGVPVHGSYLQLTLREQGSSATVVASSFHLYRGVPVDTTPVVAQDAAASIGRRALYAPADAAVVDQHLELRTLSGVLELVWATAVRGAPARALVIASGARAGRVVTVDERLHETQGNVTGFFVNGGAPGGLGVVASAGLANTTVRAPSGTAITDSAGNFVLDVPETETIEVRLSGVTGVVVDQGPLPLVASGQAQPTLSLALGSVTSDELALAQVTAYYWADRTRSFLLANGVPAEVLGEPLTINTNLDFGGICGLAYYDPAERSINFGRSGGGCNSSATDTIAAHEYGHFADDMMGGITEVSLSEGWGDLLSCYLHGIPEFGFDYRPGEVRRSCQTDYLYPVLGYGEQHEVGQAWSGFGWRVRQGLIAELGEVEGEALARQLILPSLLSNAADIPTAVREVFLRDDDDGNLGNQTPHWDVLFAAAQHHGLTFALDNDVEPPAAVADLAAVAVGPGRVTLCWTAPGDDGNQGTSSLYEIFASTRPIVTEEDLEFSGVTAALDSPIPTEAGTPQSLDMKGLVPTVPYFFAMKAYDHRYSSGLSNLAKVTTPDGFVVYQEGAENGLGEWTATGLWHVTTSRASEGAQSFWYGQEETGNYDNGAANAGTLTSPVIELGGASDPLLSFAQFIEVGDDDSFEITVTDVDDPENTLFVGSGNPSSGGIFVQLEAPLSQFVGRRVQLKFEFEAPDELDNDTAGWFIDRIRIHDLAR